MLLLLILLTSMLGVFATWGVTIVVYGHGLPHPSLLVGLAIALMWARSYEKLEGLYRAGEFDKVRRLLRLWRRGMGLGEAALFDLSMDVEARQDKWLQQDLEEARSLGLHSFAVAWVEAARLRCDGDPDGAEARLLGGLAGAVGLSRAELLMELATLRVQRALVTHGAPSDAVVHQGLEVLREVDDLLHDSDLGSGGRSRLRFLSLKHRLLRGLVWGLQGDMVRAARRYTEVIAQARNVSSLRGKRLAEEARVERLLAVRALSGEEEMDRQFVLLAKSTRLPGLRVRLNEIESYVRADRALRKAEAERAESERTKVSHERGPDSMIEMPDLDSHPSGVEGGPARAEVTTQAKGVSPADIGVIQAPQLTIDFPLKEPA